MGGTGEELVDLRKIGLGSSSNSCCCPSVCVCCALGTSVVEAVLSAFVSLTYSSRYPWVLGRTAEISEAYHRFSVFTSSASTSLLSCPALWFGTDIQCIDG